MERVETLCNLLTEKFQQKASLNEMLITVKMLESELLHLKTITPADAQAANTVAINIHKQYTPQPLAETKQQEQPEEKFVEVLHVDEAAMEAELEEIKKNVEDRSKLSIQNKPTVHFDAIEDVPTLAGRQPQPAEEPAKTAKELHESISVSNNVSLNETLRKQQTEVSDSLQDTPVKDIKKAIGINDRFTYLKELFRGDEAMYERSIKTINNFAIFPEAEYWIRRELKLKLGWDDKNEVVKQFDQLVRRRFA